MIRVTSRHQCKHPAPAALVEFQRRAEDVRLVPGTGLEEDVGRAAADEPIVPAEVVVQLEFHQLRRTAPGQLETPPARLSLHAPPTQRTEKFSSREKDCPGSGPLWGRSGRMNYGSQRKRSVGLEQLDYVGKKTIHRVVHSPPAGALARGA